jgi:hypothetical protein
MTFRRERILKLLEVYPGLTDREITDQLEGHSEKQQPVNSLCRKLESQGILHRRKRPDNLIGNYLVQSIGHKNDVEVKTKSITNNNEIVVGPGYDKENFVIAAPNNMNTKKGRDFQKFAAEVLGDHFRVRFNIEHVVPIGNPPKNHKFDLVSEDQQYIGESKNYSWTETGNVPSAKMGFINEAVFYLQHLPKEKKRFIVLRRDVHNKHGESIAEYYFRTNKHLLNGVFIIEIDVLTRDIKIIEV